MVGVRERRSHCAQTIKLKDQSTLHDEISVGVVYHLGYVATMKQVQGQEGHSMGGHVFQPYISDMF